jgi:L-ornithine N5-oxygenase
MFERLSLVGIGFGPAGIALAAALDDWSKGNAGAALGKILFFERRPTSAWHGDFLLSGTDINHHPLRDLATPRDPRSQFTFANYLHDCGRLFDFGLRGRPVSRSEWNDYLLWAAEGLRSYARYGETVQRISPVERDGALVALDVTTSGGTYRTTSLAIASGAKPNWPEAFAPFLGERVFHTGEFLPRVERIARDEALRFAVLGSGQSAAEAIIELYKRFPYATIHSIHRSAGFRLADLGHFSNLIFSPAETDYFHALSRSARRLAAADVRATNFGGLDLDGSSELYSLMYEDRITGTERVFMFNRRRVTDVEARGREYRLRLADIYTEEAEELVVDGVVLATGYHEEIFPAVMEPLRRHVALEEDGGPRVERDYAVQMTSPGEVKIYFNGMCERSHGIANGQSFSSCAARADTICRSVLRHWNLENGVRRTADLDRRFSARRRRPLPVAEGEPRPEFKLYGHYGSGHSYKVALLLTLLQAPFDYEEVDILNERGGRTPDFARIARFNEVPVLQHGAATLCQSNAILQYLARHFGRFCGQGDRDWWTIQQWLFWEMSRLNLGVANLRFALQFAPEMAAAVTELYRTRATDALDCLDQALSAQRFLVEDEPTIADVSCCGYLYWADQAGLDMTRWPHVARWLADISALPNWKPPEQLLPRAGENRESAGVIEAEKLSAVAIHS